ncbi:MAG: ABC transporter permease [Alphaproteobacteria bacterium]|nr:ABC transporter permease [Alphaproteobacteria bacterium]
MIVRSVLRRLLTAAFLVFAVVAATFFLIHLAPGDPADLMAGDAPTPEFRAEVRRAYGLDRPVPEQFLTFVGKAAQGDFGTSIYYNKPVFQVIWDRAPATFLLTGSAILLATFLGVLLGVAAARRAPGKLDTLITGGSLIGYSVPGFWIGQLLVLLFAVELGWVPTGGMISARSHYTGFAYLADLGRHMALPVFTLTIFMAAMIARFTRAAMVEAFDQDYITVAEAKGVSPGRIVWHHAFRNAVVTVVTVVGLEFGAVLAGALVIEIIFGWPGLGRLFYDAIYRRDFPLLTGSFIFTSIAVVIVNALTDIACAALDPRVRR